MMDFYAYMKKKNEGVLSNSPKLHPFMFSKNFIGVDFNMAGEAILVCKAPSHVIRTQSISPRFDVYANFESGRIVSFTIKIFDLKKSPFTIVSHNIPAKQMRKIKDIRSVAFINEADEEILSIEISPCSIPNAAKYLPNKHIDCRTLFQKKESSICKKISEQKKVINNNIFVHRDTDQNTQHIYRLCEDISANGEDAVFGHGKRMEDMIHYYSMLLSNTRTVCGLKYSMNPKKNKKPSEELCDELICIDDEKAVFIQEKSIITKLRIRDTSTISERIRTTSKRVEQAASQLKKHIESVRVQNNEIIVENGEMTIPKNIMGLIVVSEIFSHSDFFNSYINILKSDRLFEEIKLNVLSLGDYIWLIKQSEGDAFSFSNYLEEMYLSNLSNNAFCNIPCNFSIANRIGEF